MALRSLYREPEREQTVSFGALEFHDVFKIFRSGPTETVALRGLDLRVEQRELVALLGPSGCGKSTALHLAAGLDEPSAGDVVCFGRSLARLDDSELADYRAREIAIVFQSGNLWPALSARENIALTLKLAGRATTTARSSASAWEVASASGRDRSPAVSSSGWRSQPLQHDVRDWCWQTSRRQSSTNGTSRSCSRLFAGYATSWRRRSSSSRIRSASPTLSTA